MPITTEKFIIIVILQKSDRLAISWTFTKTKIGNDIISYAIFFNFSFEIYDVEVFSLFFSRFISFISS